MEILDLINLWMTTLIPFATQVVKHYFPKVSSRVITIIVLSLFVIAFSFIGADGTEMFVSIVTALATYGLILKPIFPKKE